PLAQAAEQDRSPPAFGVGRRARVHGIDEDVVDLDGAVDAPFLMIVPGLVVQERQLGPRDVGHELVAGAVVEGFRGVAVDAAVEEMELAVVAADRDHSTAELVLEPEAAVALVAGSAAGPGPGL